MPLHYYSLLQSDKLFLSYLTATFASLSPEKITRIEQEKGGGFGQSGIIMNICVLLP